MNSELVAVVSEREKKSRSVPSAATYLRVAIVSDAICGRNGVGTYYADLVSQLAQHVDRIELICPSPKIDRLVERFSLPVPGDRTQRLAFPRTAMLGQRLDMIRPNVIVVPSLGPYTYVAVRYANRNQIPVLVVNHTSFQHIVDLYWPGRFSKPLRYSLAKVQRWLIRQATGVAALNSETLREAKGKEASLVRVLGTPVARKFLTQPTLKPRRTLPTRVIFVGRLAMEKKCQDVMAAAAKLPQCEFSIAGDGPLRSEIEKCAAELPNVTYLGWLNRDQVLDAIDDADILVLPSALETFGTVALEALARRRYVLVSRHCGITDWPTLSKGLFYIESDEPLADALGRLVVRSRDELDCRASQGWLAVEEFNRHTLITWLRFLVDVASASGSPDAKFPL